jgi:outer membrane protein assembly factor BamB
MADDRIREAFDLLERDRPVPSLTFADALFERLVEERRAPTSPGRRSRQLLSPSVRKAMIAVAALAVAVAALIPLLPLARDRSRPGQLGPGEIAWVHRFSGMGGNVHSATVTASSSGPNIGFPSGPNLYGIEWELYHYGSDGRRRWTLTSVLRSPTIPIASDDGGNLYYATMHPSTPILKKYSPSGTELWAELLPFGGYIYAMAVDDTSVILVGDTFGHAPGADHPLGFHGPFVAAVDTEDGVVRWVQPVTAVVVDEERPLAVTADATGIYVLGASATATAWTLTALDPDGRVRWSREVGAARTVAVDGATVYVAGSEEGSVHVTAFSTSGTQLWNRRDVDDRGAHVTGIAAGAGGVYVVGIAEARDGPPSGFARAFDTHGNDAWSTGLGSMRVLSVAFHDGAVYIGGTVRESDTPFRHVEGFLVKLVAGIAPVEPSP